MQIYHNVRLQSSYFHMILSSISESPDLYDWKDSFWCQECLLEIYTYLCLNDIDLYLCFPASLHYLQAKH